SAHTPFEIVQRSTYVSPATPLNCVSNASSSMKLPPAPLVIVHCPVPITGSFPASVVLVVLHRSWSAPASAAVGAASSWMVTSSEEGAQMFIGLVTVQTSVYVVPGTPLNIVVGEVASTKLPPAPEAMLH